MRLLMATAKMIARLAQTRHKEQLGRMIFTPIQPKNIVLALQGGGSHGAFTWGALDRLLEDGLHFSAISGVSSGAIIATMVVQGQLKGGAEGARAAVSKLWQGLGATHVFSGMTGDTPLEWLWGKSMELGNEFAMNGFTNALRMFSPGQLNPMGQNPLAPLLKDLLDREALCHPDAAKLFVGATDVESGLSKVFTNKEIEVRHLLASACIPMMFPTVEINGSHYWDGGYSSNPPLAPILKPRPDRLILIRAQARQRRGVPSSTADIVHRLHEIAFQAPLDAELSLLPRHTKLLEISADDALGRHPLSSKTNTDKGFLDNLFAAGRLAADAALQMA